MRAYLATVERSTWSLRAISAWGTPCLSSLLISCCLGIGIVNILSFPSPAGCNRRMSRCFATREYNRRGGPVPLSMRGHPADHVGNQLPTLRENAAEPVGKTLNINSTGAGAGHILGRQPWRHRGARAPQRSRNPVHRPRVHHQGQGVRHAAIDRHGRRPLRQRHGRVRQRSVQGRARLAAQALRRSEGFGTGDVPMGLVAGTRSDCTSPWATGHRKRWKPSIMRTKRHKPPHCKGGTKIRPLQSWMSGSCGCEIDVRAGKA